MVSITLDTNLVDDEPVLAAARAAGFDVAHTTVTDRELSGSGVEALEGRRAALFETGLVGESVVGTFVPGGSDQSTNLEQVLQVVSSGSFPRAERRKDLSSGERRQLRDAMILSTHVREKRSIFVTNDRKGFIDNGRRELLQQKFGIRILSRDEFLRLCGGDNGEHSG